MVKGKRITRDHVTVQSEHLNWDPRGVRTVLSISKFAFYFNNMDIGSTSWSSINYPQFWHVTINENKKQYQMIAAIGGKWRFLHAPKETLTFSRRMITWQSSLHPFQSVAKVAFSQLQFPHLALALGASQCTGILYQCLRLISEGSILPLKTTFLYALYIPLFPSHSQIIGIETV